jgi:hypothetical protein
MAVFVIMMMIITTTMVERENTKTVRITTGASLVSSKVVDLEVHVEKAKSRQ